MEGLRKAFGWPWQWPKCERLRSAVSRIWKITGNCVRRLFRCPWKRKKKASLPRAQERPKGQPRTMYNCRQRIIVPKPTRITEVATRTTTGQDGIIPGGKEDRKGALAWLGGLFRCPWKWPKWKDIRETTRVTWIWDFNMICLERFCAWQFPTWNPDQKGLLVKTVKASKLDGLKTAVKPDTHIVVRILYVASFLIGGGIAVYLIYTTYLKFSQNPILYKYAGRVSLEDNIFPGTTICPSHLFDQKTLNDARNLYKEVLHYGSAKDSNGQTWTLEKAAKLLMYLDQTCESASSFSRQQGATDPKSTPDLKNNVDFLSLHGNLTLRDDPKDDVLNNMILPFVKRGMFSCDAILDNCIWDGDKKCTDYFEAVQTENGLCCMINRIPEHVLKTKKAAKKTEAKNMTIMEEQWGALNFEEHDFLGKMFQQRDSKVKVKEVPLRQKLIGSANGLTLVLPFKTKQMACPVNEGNGYMIDIQSPLEESRAMANGIIIAPNHLYYINLNSEVTIVDEQVKSMPRDSRQCNIEKDGFLTLFTKYTENNCEKECLIKLIHKECGCHKLFTTAGEGERICGPNVEDSKCLKKVLDAVRDNGFNAECSKLPDPMKCYISCTDIVYRYVVSSAPYFGPFDNPAKFKLGETELSSIVHIFFGSDNAVAQERHQQYDTWEIVGIIGGILGLTNGMDFMSIINIFMALLAIFGAIWALMCGIGKPSDSESTSTTQTSSTQTNPGPIRIPVPKMQMTDVDEVDELEGIFVVPDRRPTSPVLAWI